jgi:hypothetical protein
MENINSVTVLYPQVDTKHWAEQRNLPLESHVCMNCGLSQTATIPFATKIWRGLIAPIHDCGESYRLVRAREADPLRSNEWKELYSKIKENI